MEMKEFDLDLVLDEIGQFGRYQFRQYLFMALPIIFNAFFTLSYVFTAGSLNYRCQIPECEDVKHTEFHPAWLNNTVLFVDNLPEQCRRFNPLINVTNEVQFCSKDLFDPSDKINCGDFIYEDDEKTIVNEFNITCKENEWKLTLVGTINNIGQFVCLPLTGYLSDKYGRRWMLIFGILGSGIFGVLRSFSTNYISFLTYEFLDPAIGSGIYSTAFILAMELVGPKKRVMGGTIICCCYGIGEAILGLLAMYFREWRVLLRILYIPTVLCISYFWLIPESVRWLISKGKMEEAATILIEAAETNGVKMSPETLEMLCKTNLEMESLDKRTDKENYPIKEVLKLPFMMLRIANCSFCWLTNTLVYYGLSLNSVSIAGNKYMNFISVSLIELPGFFTTFLILDRLGRRKSLFGALIISGIACIVSEFVPKDQELLHLTLFLLGKFAITVSFSVLYVYTAELFPTNLRHSLLATCSMFGRIGSMVAPQTPLLANVWGPLPLVIFGGTAILSGICSLQFPETLNTKLPDTLEEAVNIHADDNNS